MRQEMICGMQGTSLGCNSINGCGICVVVDGGGKKRGLEGCGKR